jgi:repressor LexA
LLDRYTNVYYNCLVDKLTEKQRQILGFIQESFSRAGHSPTVRELSARFGVNIGAVQKHVAALIHKGFLRHTPRLSRGLDPVSRKPYVSVPVLGVIPAGSPLESIEDAQGHIHLDAETARGGEYFGLKVKGDSMRGAGIFEGDTVVVRRQQSAEDGDIVAAVVGGEATIKRFKSGDGEPYLQPENPKYRPIHSKDIQIAGKVVYLTRKI